MKIFTLQTLFVKQIYPTLLSLTLLLTPALASNPINQAFREAIDQRNVEAIRELLTFYAPDINLQNQPGQQTALMVAIAQQHIPLMEEILNRDDLNINLQDIFGHTAFFITIDSKHIALAEELVKRDDVDVNLQNMLGHTSLMLAIRQNHIPLAKHLLQRDDINVNLQDINQQTALTYIEDRHIELDQPQDNHLWYVNLVKRTQIPSLHQDHALLQPTYLQTMYTQQPFTQATKQYIDILLINKLSNKLEEKQRTIFYQGCLLAYETNNSHYSIQAKNIACPSKFSYHQPLVNENLIHLLAGYLRSVHMKRVSYTSDWAHLIRSYLWANNQFALHHNPPTKTLKEIHFWSNHHSSYAELLNEANRTQKRSLFKIIHQATHYKAVGTKHLAKGLKQKNIIQSEDQVFEKPLTHFTPIIVAGLNSFIYRFCAIN